VTACGHGSVSYANMGLCAGRKANYHRPFPFLQAKNKNENNINHGHCQKSLKITGFRTNMVVFINYLVTRKRTFLYFKKIVLFIYIIELRTESRRKRRRESRSFSLFLSLFPFYYPFLLLSFSNFGFFFVSRYSLIR
jgi:hypothetical protein